MDINIPNFNQIKVLVVGDVMLDRYWYGDTSRVSPEAPVPIVHVGQHEERPGGAGNVALNLAALGAQVTAAGLIGSDDAAATLIKTLEQHHIQTLFYQATDVPTITKLRIISLQQQLLRLDFEERFPTLYAETLLEQITPLIEQYDAIVLSDYAKGTLVEPQGIIQQAKRHSIPVLVDPKGNDFQRYRGASLLTPNNKEFQLVLGHYQTEAELVEKSYHALEAFDLQALLVTRGAKGMSLISRHQEPLHLAAHTSEVFDVTGAGDTVISVLAACIANHESYSLATQLANLAAGISVTKLGAATVTPTELHRFLHQHSPAFDSIVSEDTLCDLIQPSSCRSETIVMTNGCFDILHAGHVDYLARARAMGDKLIVAVNDDASISRLKGPTRPLNTLADRMAVLAALDCVDWVVAFSEDTPERLIARVLPDILVKGADYTDITQIAGHKQVLANGGRVELLTLKEGRSTTSIIEKIQQEQR